MDTHTRAKQALAEEAQTIDHINLLVVHTALASHRYTPASISQFWSLIAQEHTPHHQSTLAHHVEHPVKPYLDLLSPGSDESKANDNDFVNTLANQNMAVMSKLANA